MPDRPYLFDTVSLSNFAFGSLLALLTERYGSRAMLTGEVLDEIAAGVAAGHATLRLAEEHVREGKFTQVALDWQERQVYGELLRHLGSGEASCLAAAYRRGGVVVTGDRAARVSCAERRVPFTGTIGILKASCLDGQITVAAADEALSEMVRRGFYAPVSRIRDIL